MKRTAILTATLCIFATQLSLAGSDHLANATIQINSAQPEAVLDRTLSNIRSVFQRYQPVVDAQTTITSPLRVGGTQDHPTLKMSARKCVFVICQDVDLDAEVSVRVVSGNCKKNLLVNADLRRSSQALADVYDHLQVSICFNESRPGAGVLNLTGQAHRAPNYSAGRVQQEIFKLLQLQIPPITRALNETLRHNGKDF